MRGEFSGAVGFNDHPPLFEVDKSVMTAAKEHGVLKGGVSAVFPEDDVVDVAVLWWAVAAGTHTGPVAGDNGAPQGRRDRASGPAHVEDLRGTSGDDARDRGVAADQLRLRRGDRPDPPQLRWLDRARSASAAAVGAGRANSDA